MPDNLNLNLDQNLNLNLNLGATGSQGSGPRYNTEDFAKLIPRPFPNNLPLPTLSYRPDWAPEYRAWAFVQDFIVNGGFGNDPVTKIKADIDAQTDFPVPGVTLTTALMKDEVENVLHRAIKRPDRANEILDQASGPGALRYWTGLLRLDPSQDKDAWLLMLVAHKIGEFVAMGLKDKYLMRRPAQVYPWIMPLIDGPDTPSYPSSHSLQAHLITGVLKLALTPSVEAPLGAVGTPPSIKPFLKTPQEIVAVAAASVNGAPSAADIAKAKNAGAWVGGADYPETAKALDILAYRVATNREVAGVHYRMDTMAGRYAALVCLRAIAALAAAGDPFMTLLADAKAELKDFH
jgi:hypothetical protein